MAKEHYKLGLDAYKNGRYPEAIKELKKAYLLKRLPALLLNIGATYRKMGDVDNAVYYYKKYLAEAPDAKDCGEVQATLAELDKEKPGAGAGATGSGATEAPAAAQAAAAPPASSGEWKHTPPDAAPPDQPLDVRVQMPVSKGVHVYVYYRGAGQADFNQVLMRRHGGEKVGRIPADAMSGKSVQYYVEGKDDKGNVVKSFGSAADPNIVRIDSSAAPQVVASGGAAAGGAAAEDAHADLDDEAAPITGEVAERPNKKHKGSSTHGAEGERTTRFGKAFWAGAAVAVLGVASFAIGSYFLYQAKSYSDVLTADSQYRDPNTGQPYKFTDPNATPYDDKTVEARGIRDNNIGIALTTVGGIFAIGGVALMVVDQTDLQAPGREAEEHRLADADGRPGRSGRGRRRHLLMLRAAPARLALLSASSLLVIGCFSPKVVSGGFACNPNANPACPDGYICVDNRCVNGSPPVRIMKTGDVYAGQHTDPGLTTTADCPDESLEPNDGPTPPDGTPVLLTAPPDTIPAKLTNLAICPTGLNPATRRHDVDYYRIDVGAGVATIMAELFYDITYGDVDVGIFDAGGTLLGSDGTAVSNACATAPVSAAGTYFVVVVGANDVDVNRYDLRVRTLSKIAGCAANDMGTP